MPAICPVLRGRSLFYFCSSQEQTDHPHLLLQRAASPITSSPDLFFPLCLTQCSFLAGCTLIKSLSAYLGLAETKQGFFFLKICWEGRQWQHFVVNCLAMWGTIGMSYLRRAGENWGRAYLFAESWPLWAHDVQFVEEILQERMMVVGASSSSCWCNAFSPPSFCQGAVCLLVQKIVDCGVFGFTLAWLLYTTSCAATTNQLGQQALMRCTTGHTTQQLLTHCCVHTPLSSNTNWGQ